MNMIKKKYLFDENQNKVAVQIDITEYNRIEQMLEDYALGKLMEENEASENMGLEEAQIFYSQLKKSSSGENSGQ